MMHVKTKFSQCIATYNGEQFIYEQITSILPQLDLEDEIIVSDDGSTDKTISILESFNDGRIKIFKGPCKGHPRYNFENALKYASGDWIFLSDQDDEWLPNKVDVISRFLKEFDMVISNCYVVDGNNSIIRDYYYPIDNYPVKHGFLHTLLRPNYLGCCMAFRRSVLELALPFPDKIAQHDIWLGLCADAFNLKIEFISERLMNYKRYGDNFSPMGKSKYPVYLRIWFRIYFLYHIILRRIKIAWRR